jgi:signal transduction histidine kinase
VTAAPDPGSGPPGPGSGPPGPGSGPPGPGSGPQSGRSPGRWPRLPERWLRLPRRTVRLRLTVVYGGLFLLLGAALLGITYLLVSKQLPNAPGQARASTSIQSGTVFFRTATGNCQLNGSPAVSGGQLQTQAQQCLSEQRAVELNQLLTESGIALAIMTVVAIGLGWLVAGRMLGKLRTITAAARSVSASSLHARLALPGPDDELKELGDTFDGLLARLEAAFGAQRQFVANASHELRTPLARQRTLIEVALADPEPSAGSLRAVCERVLVTGEQQERLIEALLTLARSQRGLDRREPIDLAAIAGEVVLGRWPDGERRGLTVTTGLQPAPALGDASLAERLVANLVDNAIRHNVPGGAVEVGTAVWAGHTVVSVFSTGPAIPPDNVDRLFQPFYRGAARDRTGNRDGLGLGLSIVAAIAEAHGAWIRAHALPGGGLGLRVGFPLAPAARPPPPVPPPPAAALPGAVLLNPGQVVSAVATCAVSSELRTKHTAAGVAPPRK